MATAIRLHAAPEKDCCSEPCKMPTECIGTTPPIQVCAEAHVWLSGNDHDPFDTFRFTLHCDPTAGTYIRIDVSGDSPIQEILFGPRCGVATLYWQTGAGLTCAFDTVDRGVFIRPTVTINSCDPLSVSFTGGFWIPIDSTACDGPPTELDGGRIDWFVTAGVCVPDSFPGCHDLSVCSDADMPDYLCVTLTHLRCAADPIGGTVAQGVLVRGVHGVGTCAWSGVAHEVGTNRAIGCVLTFDSARTPQFKMAMATFLCCGGGNNAGAYDTITGNGFASIPYVLTCAPFHIVWSEATYMDTAGPCQNLHTKVSVGPAVFVGGRFICLLQGDEQ